MDEPDQQTRNSDALEIANVQLRMANAQLHQSREELQLSEESLQLAVESAKIGIWHWDIVTGELVWSDRCREIFGVPKGETLRYERFLAALHPDDREPTNTAVKAALDGRGDFAVEYRSIWPDGSLHWIEALGRGFYNEKHEPVRMQGAVLDVSERKRADAELKKYAEELERSNADLARFASVAAHDLKEPLRVISSYCELLGARFAGQFDEKGERYLKHITSAAKRMRQLISDLLEFSRIGAGAKDLAPVELDDVLNEALDNLDTVIRKRRADIVGTEALPKVLGDRGQLVQLFQNLIGNAIKFCKTSPRVEVTARRAPNDPRRWEVRISDNGPGIEPEYQARIFEIFQRVDADRGIEGTGIGLAVCRRILECHGGEIRVESEVGEGSRFFFTLAGAPI